MKGCIYERSDGDFGYAPFANRPNPRKNHRPKDGPKCGAKTRKGTPCQAPPVWDPVRDRPRNGRCKLHGGLSTGPKGKRAPPPTIPAGLDLDNLLRAIVQGERDLYKQLRESEGRPK